MTRTFAIINMNADKINYNTTICSKLPENSSVFIFSPLADSTITEVTTKNITDNITEVIFPETDVKNLPKCHNFAVNYIKNVLKLSGYLYVFSDIIQITDKTKFEFFLPEIEELMDKFELDTWFNTVTDKANYVFSKYDPRLRVDIDEPALSSIYDKTILWATCANNNLICFNLDKVSLEQMQFDPEFSIAMFYILEYVARRRHNASDSWPFINFYPTLESELGIISYIKSEDGSINTSVDHINKNDYAKEEEIFNQRSINFQGDSQFESVLAFMVNKLNRFVKGV